MSTEAKIAALKGAAERKRNDALERTNQAITQLVKEGKKITFAAVAEAAGVSVLQNCTLFGTRFSGCFGT